MMVLRARAAGDRRAYFGYRRVDLDQKHFAPFMGSMSGSQRRQSARCGGMGDTTNDLVLKCTAAARDGADFPTVWEAVLRRHALVLGPPI